jgi:hypothetical protein
MRSELMTFVLNTALPTLGARNIPDLFMSKLRKAIVLSGLVAFVIKA